MAAMLVVNEGLAEALRDEGFPLPDEVRAARLIVDSTIVIQYDVFVTDEDLVKFARALSCLADAKRKSLT